MVREEDAGQARRLLAEAGEDVPGQR